MLYDLATDEQRQILKQQYDIAPFQIMTISLERAFIDKLFAAEAYTRKSSDPHRAFEAAKHLYDLAVMSKLPRIQQLYHQPDQMKHLLDIRMEEESNRLDGIPGVVPQEFTFFDGISSNTAIRKAYETMQNQYVLRSSDRIIFFDATAAMKQIQQHLQSCHGWREYRMPVKIRLVIAQREAERHNAEKLAFSAPEKTDLSH